MPEFKALLEGYRRFRTGAYQEQRRRYDALADKGQAPGVLVIACSDSRVDPTRVFDTEPGQMFVVRNVANLVPPFDPDPTHGQHSTSAAIEYAVTQLKVHHILVLGHARCGGIKASIEGTFDDAAPGEGGFIKRWMSQIAPARDTIRAAAQLSPDIDACSALELAAIRLSIDNLRSFPFIAEAEESGALHLQGALFDIAEGVLRVLNHESGKFEALSVDWEEENVTVLKSA
ncbi:MAG: carbonate dehydratase [Sphingomonadales bacterium 32-65-25]|jgi:carbonic anhydrase|uniref:carbonic anhydrase n=1 Tax=Sandarakinorhabdus TaxID=362865 RepID=UPI000BD29D6C|nr:carbonic anhydrase [Sandarakinorhabdus sp.]OYX78701.1 MAG: carbonate dehydratase [Sphingomonadales bacterium 32-65-25]